MQTRKRASFAEKQKTKKRSIHNEENRSLVVENMTEGMEDGIAVKLEVRMEDQKSLL